MHTACEFDTFEFEVFNRWGQVVWRSNDASDPWDGGVNVSAALATITCLTGCIRTPWLGPTPTMASKSGSRPHPHCSLEGPSGIAHQCVTSLKKWLLLPSPAQK